MTRGPRVLIATALLSSSFSSSPIPRTAFRVSEANQALARNAVVLQTPDTATGVHDFDGLTVIHRYQPESEVVAVDLYLLGGSRQISDSTAGIEPLLLRVSEHGTERYPGHAARHALARTGSWTSVQADLDWTVFGMRGLAEAFDSTWAVFADRLMHPTLDSSGFEIERAKMVAAARARQSDPEQRVITLVSTAAFVDHPYGRDVLGTEASLTRLTADDLRGYLAEQLVRSRMLLVVVGNVSLDQVRTAVDGTLGELPVGDYVWELPPAWSGDDPAVVLERKEIPTKYVFGYFGGPQASSEERGNFRVAVVVLSSLISARVSEEGLTYSGGAVFFDQGATGGAIHFSTDDPKQCVTIANEAMELIKMAAIPRHYLRDYARGTLVGYYSRNETSGEQAEALARSYLFRGVLPSPEEHVDELIGVSGSDLKFAARKYFKNIYYGLLGDTTNAPREQMTKN